MQHLSTPDVSKLKQAHDQDGIVVLRDVVSTEQMSGKRMFITTTGKYATYRVAPSLYAHPAVPRCDPLTD